MNTKISNKGWIVIPAELRRKYHLVPGGEVQIIDYGGVLEIVPLKTNPIEDSVGSLSGGKRSLTKALLDDHQMEMANE